MRVPHAGEEAVTEGGTSADPPQVGASLCDITKGWPTHSAAEPENKAKDRLFSFLAGLHADLLESVLKPVCQKCKTLVVPQFVVARLHFLLPIRTIRSVVLQRIPRATHNSPSVEAPLMRLM